MDAAIENKALAWLDEKWPQERRKCPICATNDWQLGEIVLWHAPSDLDAEPEWPPTPDLWYVEYPLLQVYCRNCGYTIAFNARIAGLVLRGNPR